MKIDMKAPKQKRSHVKRCKTAHGWFSVSPWPLLPWVSHWECTPAPYHRDPPRAGCSCRAPPSPCATAAAGSPLPAPPRRGSWRWCRPGRQGSCGRPSWTRCTRSARWPTRFDCTTGWFPPGHNCAQGNAQRGYTDKAESASFGWDTNDQVLSVFLFYKLELL